MVAQYDSVRLVVAYCGSICVIVDYVAYCDTLCIITAKYGLLWVIVVRCDSCGLLGLTVAHCDLMHVLVYVLSISSTQRQSNSEIQTH